MLNNKKMFDYDKLIKELNEYVPYLLQCFKREYGTFLSEEKATKLDELLASKEDLVVIDGEVGKDKIHIIAYNEMFENQKYDYIKQYHLINIVIPTILKWFITININDQEFKKIDQPNFQQEFSRFLRNGFISYIFLEFSEKNRLDLTNKVEKETFDENLKFIYEIKKIIPEGRPFMEIIFRYDYLECLQKVYEYSGEDLLEFYMNFIDKNNTQDRGKK